MKSFKQIFAIIFTIAVVVFGVLVVIEEKDLFSSMSQLSFDGWAAAKITIIWILLVLADVSLIALPVLGFILVLTGKYDPYKAIVNCAIVMLIKFVISVVVSLVLISAFQDYGAVIDWKEVFFEKDSMLIIPLSVFGLALITVTISKFSNFEGSLVRAVLATIGSGLAIFGLVYYFGVGAGSGGILNSGDKSNWLDIMGLIIGIACFAGIVVYSFLPQTREFKKAE